MSFRHLVGLLLLVSILLGIGSALAIRHLSRLPDLYQMEMASDRKDVERIRGMLVNTRSQLERVAADFSLQNAFEIYEVLAGKVDASEQLWLPPMLENLSGIVIVDVNGNTLHNENYQRGRYARNLEDGLANYLLRSPNFKPTEYNPLAQGSGFAATSTGIVIVGVVPIRWVNDDSHQIAGYILAWQEVNAEFFELISRLSQTELRFVRELDFGERFTHQQQFQAMFESPDMISPRDEHGHIYWLVPDYNGEPLFFVRQMAGPRVFEIGLVDKPTMVSLSVLSLCLLLFYWVLGHYTFTPLEKAEKLLEQLASNPNDERRLPELPAKELNSMFRSFNKLLSIILEQRNILQARNLELDALSTVDALTGVKNRRSLDKHLKDSVATARRMRAPMAVMMLDIDEFKAYNDNYGHQRGDDALRYVAETLNQQLQRSTDFFARYGGEEFCAVVMGADEGAIASIAERLRVSVAELFMAHKYSAAKHITISIGATVLEPRHSNGSASSTVVHLLESADRALYQAKRQGRNRVIVGPYSDAHSHSKSHDKANGDGKVVPFNAPRGEK